VKCPRCGGELPSGGALEGLCPACLLKADLDEAGSGPTPFPPTGAEGRSGDGDDGQEPPPIEDVQRAFPQLEVLELVGRGGMGLVYRARQPRLDRLVALKVLAPELARDATFAERFLREARALARLNHPNIVAVYDFGESGGSYYLVMEFVDGVVLRDVIADRSLSAAQALAIVPQVCEGLQYAHEQGIVHRDIKPENILLDRAGRAKIADFGLAKLVGRDGDGWTLTRATQVMGTPHYMAPEQMRASREVDHRADIYSLGVVLYEMLTDDLPVGRFALPSEKVRVDVKLDEVVLKALEKEPEQRYQHASELKTDVEGLARATATPSAAPEDGPAAPEDGPAAPEDGPAAPAGATAGAARAALPPALPFKISEVYAGFAETHGLLRLEGDALVFEFQTRDSIVGLVKSAIREQTIPLADLGSAAYQRKLFGAHVLLTLRRLRAPEPRAGVVPDASGRLRLRFKREHAADAKRLAEHVQRSIAARSGPAGAADQGGSASA